VTGHGLALAAVVIEQDAAYWEVHVELSESAGTDAVASVMIGVATKKDRNFYTVMEESDEGNSISVGDPAESPDNGTALMSKIAVSNGDVIGVAVQQSDLPMIQLHLNGNLIPDSSINRFRGTVYPSVHLPEVQGLSLQFVFREVDLKKSPPSSRFCPVMVARGLV
jgi:hypothetical protein